MPVTWYTFHKLIIFIDTIIIYYAYHLKPENPPEYLVLLVTPPFLSFPRSETAETSLATPSPQQLADHFHRFTL